MSFQRYGYELLPQFIAPQERDNIVVQTESLLKAHKGGGVRQVEKHSCAVNKLVSSTKLLKTAEKYLAAQASLVRAILFDKTADSNWLVSWHQDKTVAVDARFDRPGWGPWSIKKLVHHVQVPVEVLQQMVTFRVHLDPCSTENGCLKVISGSHREGVLSQAQISRLSSTMPVQVIEAPVCSALVMRPHLLHASSKATSPARRRILHLEYSSYRLPDGISWL